MTTHHEAQHRAEIEAGRQAYLNNQECPVNASPAFFRGYNMAELQAEALRMNEIRRAGR